MIHALQHFLTLSTYSVYIINVEHKFKYFKLASGYGYLYLQPLDKIFEYMFQHRC